MGSSALIFWMIGRHFVRSAFRKQSWTPSFRDGPKDQTRNLEIPGSMLRIAPE